MKYFWLTTMIFCFSIPSFAQGSLFNIKYPKPNGVELEAVGVYELSTGNYFGIGRHEDGSYFIRIDKLGNKLSDLISYDQHKALNSIQKKNGNFLIAGVLSLDSSSNVYLREVDSSGTAIWTTYINYLTNPFEGFVGIDLLEMDDGSIRVLFPNEYPTWYGLGQNSDRESYFLKTDSVGNLQDTTILQYSYADFDLALDSGFILIGGLMESSTRSLPIITKLDLNGDSVWSKIVDSLPNLFGNEILTLDSTYLISCNDGIAFDGNSSPGFMIHLNKTGQNAGNIGMLSIPNIDFEAISYMVRSSDNGIIMGTSSYYCDNPGDCFETGAFSKIYKFDSTFELEWCNPIYMCFAVSVSWYGVKSINKTSSGYVAIGSTLKYYQMSTLTPIDVGRLNIWTYDTLGNIAGSVEIDNSLTKFVEIFPNPVNDLLNIKLNRQIDQVVIRIHNLNGNLVLEKNLNENENNLDVSMFNSGIYFYEIQSEERVLRDKLIIQK